MGTKRGFGMLLVLGVCLTFLVLGCAILERPTGKVATAIVAREAGYLIAREDPELAATVLVYTRRVAEHDFEDWRAWVLAEVADEPLLRMRLEALMSLIETDLAGAVEDGVDVVVPILRHFIEGIEVGLRVPKRSDSVIGPEPLPVPLLAGFTWEGELNPNEFDDWELVSVRPAAPGYFWVFVENPDRASSIDVVVMEVDLDSNMLSYRYFKYGEPRLYVFDRDRGGYVRYSFTREEKESCARCHGGESERDSLHRDMEGI